MAVDLPEPLERRYGPYRGWQWLAIIAAAMVLAWAVNRYMNRGRGGPTDPTQGGPYTGLPRTGPTHSPQGAPDITQVVEPVSGNGDEPAPVEILTNRDWIKAAHDHDALDAFSPALLDQALRRYLQGKQLTPEQFKAVETTLRVIGPPPEGAPPLEQTPVPSDPGPTRKTPAPGDTGGGSRPRGRSGWDSVVDNLDAEFVVHWSGQTRYVVGPEDRELVAQAFGRPKRRMPQTPGRYQAAVRRWVEEDLGGNYSPTGRIVLDVRAGPHGGIRHEQHWDGQGLR